VADDETRELGPYGCFRTQWLTTCQRPPTAQERQFYAPNLTNDPACQRIWYGDPSAQHGTTGEGAEPFELPAVDESYYDRCGAFPLDVPWIETILQSNDAPLGNILVTGGIRFGLAVAAAWNAAAYAQGVGDPFYDLLAENVVTSEVVPAGGGVAPMGLWDDIWGTVTDIGLKDVTGFVGEANQFINQFESNQGPPVPQAVAPVAGGPYLPVATQSPLFPEYDMGYGSQVPVTVEPGVSIMPYAQSLGKYILSIVRRVAPSVTWKKLLSAARLYGIPFLVGLGLTLDLANYVMKQAHKKRRHINPANVKALRRSVRRLDSFDRLACKVSAQLAHIKTGGSTRRRSGRCRKCRQTTCRC